MNVKEQNNSEVTNHYIVSVVTVSIREQYEYTSIKKI